MKSLEKSPIKSLLNVSTLKEIKKTKWVRRFLEMSLTNQQPWYDRVLVWMEQNREKHAAFLQVKPEQRNMVFQILAAGFWFQNKPIEFLGYTAVRTEDPDGTGLIDKDRILFTEGSI